MHRHKYKCYPFRKCKCKFNVIHLQSHPAIQVTFEDLGLHSKITEILCENGINKPTEIQVTTNKACVSIM